jgi:hypothetical protein
MPEPPLTNPRTDDHQRPTRRIRRDDAIAMFGGKRSRAHRLTTVLLIGGCRKERSGTLKRTDRDLTPALATCRVRRVRFTPVRGPVC